MSRAAAAIVLLASLCAAPARAQMVLRARDGGTEHTLFVAGGVGLYLVAPAGAPAVQSTACVVRIRSDGEIPLEVDSDVALSTEASDPGPAGVRADRRCDRERMPRLAQASGRRPAALLLRRGARHVRVPTEVSTYLQLAFPDPDAAWRAAATIARAVRHCGLIDGSPDWTDLMCDVGLRIMAGRARPVVSLQWMQGIEMQGECDAYLDAYGFDGSTIDESTSVCARGHWITAWSTREELAAALGTCAPWPDDPHSLRCGAYRVSMDSRGRPSGVRAAR